MSLTFPIQVVTGVKMESDPCPQCQQISCWDRDSFPGYVKVGPPWEQPQLDKNMFPCPSCGGRARVNFRVYVNDIPLPSRPDGYIMRLLPDGTKEIDLGPLNPPKT